MPWFLQNNRYPISIYFTNFKSGEGKWVHIFIGMPINIMLQILIRKVTLKTPNNFQWNCFSLQNLHNWMLSCYDEGIMLNSSTSRKQQSCLHFVDGNFPTYHFPNKRPTSLVITPTDTNYILRGTLFGQHFYAGGTTRTIPKSSNDKSGSNAFWASPGIIIRRY